MMTLFVRARQGSRTNHSAVMRIAAATAAVTGFLGMQGAGALVDAPDLHYGGSPAVGLPSAGVPPPDGAVAVPLPQVPLPQAQVPSPQLPLPQVPLPQVPLPQVSLPQVPLPEVPLPEVLPGEPVVAPTTLAPPFTLFPSPVTPPAPALLPPVQPPAALLASGLAVLGGALQERDVVSDGGAVGTPSVVDSVIPQTVRATESTGSECVAGPLSGVGRPRVCPRDGSDGGNAVGGARITNDAGVAVGGTRVTTGSSLPTTGAQIGGLVIVALGLCAIGVFLVKSARAREGARI